jgi:hypothetical protein
LQRTAGTSWPIAETAHDHQSRPRISNKDRAAPAHDAVKPPEALALTGLALALLGALVLAWRDLTAKRVRWDTLNSEPLRRRLFAWVGFPLIAAGSILQLIGVATDSDHLTATQSRVTRSVVCEVEVSFLPGATNADIAAARDAVSTNSDVASIRFVSSAEAFALMKKRFPDLAKNLPANPLGASLRITLRPGASTASVFRELNRIMGMPRGNRLTKHICT